MKVVDPTYICEWCEESEMPDKEPEKCKIMICPKHGKVWFWPKKEEQNA